MHSRTTTTICVISLITLSLFSACVTSEKFKLYSSYSKNFPSDYALLYDSTFLYEYEENFITGRLVKKDSIYHPIFDSLPFNTQPKNIIQYKLNTKNKINKQTTIRFTNATYEFIYKFDNKRFKIKKDTSYTFDNFNDSLIEITLYSNSSNQNVCLNFVGNKTLFIPINPSKSAESNEWIIDCLDIYLYYSFNKNGTLYLVNDTNTQISSSIDNDTLRLQSKKNKHRLYRDQAKEFTFLNHYRTINYSLSFYYFYRKYLNTKAQKKIQQYRLCGGVI